MKKIGVLGSGAVAKVLASGFAQHGYDVCLGSRTPDRVTDWNGTCGSYAVTAAHGEIVVLAVKGTAAESALMLAGVNNLTGKIVIDVTNPIADATPVNGVLKFFTSLDESLMERLQRTVPEARFVKAFNSVGSAHMVNPNFGGVKPTMFICGNDAGAKKVVSAILNAFGWESEDMGGAEAARAIEPLCMLWCIPGLLRNDWSHAFKLLKK